MEKQIGSRAGHYCTTAPLASKSHCLILQTQQRTPKVKFLTRVKDAVSAGAGLAVTYFTEVPLASYFIKPTV